MSRKTAEDLDENPSSIGGAMSQWPRRTINWICRDQRVQSVDSHVAETLLDREVGDLKQLSDMADRVGISSSNLDGKIEALEDHDTDEILAAIQQRYESEHGDSGVGVSKCPFEESGMDKACWRCPVAGQTLEELARR